ncbi:MAG: POTRA domain-containing protein, partial [Nitrospiria bacterium]
MIRNKEKVSTFFILIFFFIFGFLPFTSFGHENPEIPQKILFTINGFQIDGNTLLLPEKIKERVTPFEGEKKEMGDVENVRSILEKAYHDAGYPAVIVLVPEQTLENGIVKMSVIESRLGKV